MPGFPGGEPPPPPAEGGPQLPPGTYAEARDSSGAVTCHTSFSFGESETPQPKLPDRVDASSPGEPSVFDVPAQRGSSSFRAAAVATPGGGSLIVAVPLTDFEDTLHRLLTIDALVLVAVLVAMAALTLWIVRASLRPLDEMGDTARAIAAGELDRRVSETNERTEVGRLGVAFNDMLARIQEALRRREESEERLRRFLADASHELRTPLSSIRGYAELFRLGAANDPEKLETALARIESEAARMGTLVDELMALARFDERVAPVVATVRLDAIAAEAVADAGAAHPDREITLAAKPTIVLGDEGPLRQVISNLLENAVVHDPAGNPVEVRVGEEGSCAVLSVRDGGPGIPPGSEGDVFDRFWRADRSRERAKGGSGLGLAIVRAIVEAHGGTAEARNPEGGGALFTILLPLRSSGGPQPES
jgi:two-component system OmpR family sensor kinase